MRLRVVALLACLLYCGGSAFAQGPCPAGLPVSGNNCYFIAANGNDSNNAVSEATPWQHTPWMPNCSANCGSVTLPAGTGLIFRGGDTWHFGNNAASPAVGGTWAFGSGGSLGNSIYIGVDKTWFTGGVWTRPIFTADNATSTSTTLGPCSFHVGTGNNMIDFSGSGHFILDNFELTGFCQDSTGAPNGRDQYISYGSSPDVQFLNLYIHGWTHQQFFNMSDPQDCGPMGNQICFNISIFHGGSEPVTPDDVFRNLVVDGSDSDPEAAQACYCDFWDVANSYIGNQSNVITRYQHLFHDNVYEYWYENGHGNVLESVGDPSGTNAMYNNVVRQINPLNQAGDPGFWPQPPVGSTNYFFNNVTYAWTNMEYFNVGQNSGDQGSLVIFNNTMQYNTSSNIFGWVCPQVFAHPVAWTNNHYIDDAASAYTAGCASAGSTMTTERLMSNATATANGYTAGQTFAYSPTAGGSPTVGAGTNRSAYCTALTSAGLSAAGTACLSDTTYAITYNATTHTTSGPARSTNTRGGTWDQGAYQFSGAPPPPAGPPATLSGGAKLAGTISVN